MPQASDEYRERMRARFGDPVCSTGPIEFLQKAGYALGRDWCWRKPGVENYDAMTADEYECLVFLIDEWDFGGLRAVNETEEL